MINPFFLNTGKVVDHQYVWNHLSEGARLQFV